MKNFGVFKMLTAAVLAGLSLCSASAQEQIAFPPVANQEIPLNGSLQHNRLPENPAMLEAGRKAQASILQGETLTKAGDLENAITAFQTALSYKPDFDLAYQRLAEVYTTQGNAYNAIDAYQHAIYPVGHSNNMVGNPTVMMRFALLLLQTGQRQEALAAYQQGWRFLPTDRGPLPPLFTSLKFTPKQFQAAAYTAIGLHECEWIDNDADFETAIRLQPDLAAPYYYRGHFLKYKEGRSAEALEAFRKAGQYGGPAMRPFLDKALKEGSSSFRAAALKEVR